MEILPIRDPPLSGAVLNAYERVLASLHRPNFEAAIVGGFRAVLAWERLYVFHGDRIEDSTLRVSSYEADLAAMVPVYRRRYLPCDPLCSAADTLDHRTRAFILRLEPADIAEEGYRRAFLEDRGIVERVTVLQRSAGGWRGVNIVRHRREGPCSARDLAALTSLGQLILPMVDIHYGPPTPLALRENLSDVERRFGKTCPSLTGRERQVCARAALGMSVEATALDLGVARTSVLTYRKRAYERLKVTSPYGLAALVLH